MCGLRSEYNLTYARVFEAGGRVKRKTISMGGRRSCNPKNKGKKSYQPILTFLAETREYMGGELRNGDRPTGQQIARHLESVFAAGPSCVDKIFARADAGFYCRGAVEAYEKGKASFIIAREQDPPYWRSYKRPAGRPRPRPMPTNHASFGINPRAGAGTTPSLPCVTTSLTKESSEAGEQYQLFDSPQYRYRVFVTDMQESIDVLQVLQPACRSREPDQGSQQ
jgi:hypothetical protein